MSSKGSSWVIVDKKSLKSVLETHNSDVVKHLNKEKYAAVEVYKYLQGLNIKDVVKRRQHWGIE